MANEQELAEQRNRLAGKSRADLLHEKHRASPNIASCIVATQLLDEMDQSEARAATERQRRLQISVDGIHRIDIWILIAGVIAALASVILLALEILRACGAGR